MEAVHHRQSSRIFHDFNSPSSSRKVAGGQRSQHYVSIMSCKAQAGVADEAGRQCSSTPSASMHPRPNPSFLSMVASRHCLGALSKGTEGGGKKSKKGAKQKDSELHTERQGERRDVQDALCKEVWCTT